MDSYYTRRDFVLASLGAVFGAGATSIISIGKNRLDDITLSQELIVKKEDVNEAIEIADSITLSRILDNAATIYPKSRPYLEMIVDEWKATGKIIDVVGFISKIQQESKFYPHAVSPAFAEGIAQFMEDTARADMKMHVYVPLQFSELAQLKADSKEAFSVKRRDRKTVERVERSILQNKAYRINGVPASAMRDLTRAEELLAESIRKECKAFRTYKQGLYDILQTYLPDNVNEFDDRHVPRTAIRKSLEYDIRNFRELKGGFKGPVGVLAMWAFVAYNHGLYNVYRNPGLPSIARLMEPHEYMSQIAVNMVELHVGKRLRKDKKYYDNTDFWLTPKG